MSPFQSDGAAQGVGRGPTDRSPGAALCRRFTGALPITGASLSVVGAGEQHSTIGATDDLAAELESLQYQLGEGPHWQSFRSGVPILVPDLEQDAQLAGWPVFADQVRRTPAAALFAFPLLLAGAPVGVVDMYSTTATEAWPEHRVARASRLAAGVTDLAVHLATSSASRHDAPAEGTVELRREVHQATGMVLVQLDCGPVEALARLRAHAFAAERSLDDVARDVVSGVLRFDSWEP